MGYLGFYNNAAKTTAILESTSFISNTNRKDNTKEGHFTLSDGSLRTWQVYTKYGEKLILKKVNQTDRDALYTEYALYRAFYYYPDIIDRSTEVYQVRLIKKPREKYNKKTQLYTINIEIIEV